MVFFVPMTSEQPPAGEPGGQVVRGDAMMSAAERGSRDRVEEAAEGEEGKAGEDSS
jgi:hypothetical protein